MTLKTLFDYSQDIIDLAVEILDRRDDEETFSEVSALINDTVYYDDDYWTIIKHYCRPTEANLTQAMYWFTLDITNYIQCELI